MKKIFSIVMVAALVAFSITSCKKNGQNEPENPQQQDSTQVPVDTTAQDTTQVEPAALTFEITIGEVTSTEATITVTPSDNEVYYYWSLVDASYLAQYSADELAAMLMEDEVEYYESTFESLIEDGYIVKGEDTYTYEGLDPETEYAVLAFPVDEALAVTGETASKNFTTGKLVISETVELSYDNAELTDYTAYGMFQVAIEDEADNFYAAITFYAESLEGDFTTDDLWADYSGVAVGEEMYSIVTISAKGELLNDGADYKLSGEMAASNGVLYKFTFIASTAQEEELEDAPARLKKAAKKATRTVKTLKF